MMISNAVAFQKLQSGQFIIWHHGVHAIALFTLNAAISLSRR